MKKLLLYTLLFGLLTACEDGRKLDEFVFYKGPNFSLKVVRYYRNLFLSYNGEVFSVQCSSKHTRKYKKSITQDEGWRQLSSGGAIGTKSAQDVFHNIGNEYTIIDDKTILVTTSGISVSFDACQSFHRWYPTQLPSELINPVEKPSHCAPKGTGDCRHYDFLDDRKPTYEDVKVDTNGTISFLTSSKSYKDVNKLRVTSTDFGKTWSIEKL